MLKAKKYISEFLSRLKDKNSFANYGPSIIPTPVPPTYQQKVESMEVVYRIHRLFKEFVSARYAPDAIAQANEALIKTKAEIIFLREAVKKQKALLQRYEENKARLVTNGKDGTQ